MAELFVNNINSARLDAPNLVAISTHGLNMAMENWDCDYQIDFENQSVTSNFENYTGRDLSAENACGAEVVELR